MNQMEVARAGKTTKEMEEIASMEDVPLDKIRDGVAVGEIAIAGESDTRSCRPVAFGRGLRTKINANVGTSSDSCDPKLEVEKAQLAVKTGADTVMDLSTFGPINDIRSTIIKSINVPVGTVPLYQVAEEAMSRTGTFLHMTDNDILRTVESHAQQGCGSITVHCGVTRDIIEHLAKHDRIMKITSRGGSIIARWVISNQKENPLYERFDDLLDIAIKYDLVISLGTGLRAGCLADGGDDIHLRELIILGELVLRAWKRNVQVKVEGPGHLAIDEIDSFIKVAKKLCHRAPLGALGPIVTDIAPGYDHITHAIGFAVAAMAGADFASAVYPSEHLGLPQLEDIVPGIMAARIAAHIGDLVRLGKKA